MSKPLDDAWVWLKTQASGNGPLLLVLAFLVLIGGAWGRSAFVALVDERVAPLAKKQDRYEAEVVEFRLDIRELYKVTPWVRQSQRLEALPLRPDGGE